MNKTGYVGEKIAVVMEEEVQVNKIHVINTEDE